MIMASIILFELFGRGKGGAAPRRRPCCATFLRRVVVNPLIVGILPAWPGERRACRCRDLAVRFVDALADIAGPLALFAMGLGLQQVRHLGQCPAGAGAVAAEAVADAGGGARRWPGLLGLPPLTAKVAVAAAALPSGVNSYLIAAQFGTGQALASNQMTIATACAVRHHGVLADRRQAVFG